MAMCTVQYVTTDIYCTFTGAVDEHTENKTALFPIKYWNCFERVKQGLQRTTNTAEGWNNSWNNALGRVHPTLGRLFRQIYSFAVASEFDIEQVQTVGSCFWNANECQQNLVHAVNIERHLNMCNTTVTLFFNSVQYEGGVATRRQKNKDVVNDAKIVKYVKAYNPDWNSRELLQYIERFSYLCTMTDVHCSDDSDDTDSDN